MFGNHSNRVLCGRKTNTPHLYCGINTQSLLDRRSTEGKTLEAAAWVTAIATLVLTVRVVFAAMQAYAAQNTDQSAGADEALRRSQRSGALPEHYVCAPSSTPVEETGPPAEWSELAEIWVRAHAGETRTLKTNENGTFGMSGRRAERRRSSWQRWVRSSDSATSPHGRVFESSQKPAVCLLCCGRAIEEASREGSRASSKPTASRIGTAPSRSGSSLPFGTLTAHGTDLTPRSAPCQTSMSKTYWHEPLETYRLGSGRSNNRLQATAYSLRSCVATASGGRLKRGVGCLTESRSNRSFIYVAFLGGPSGDRTPNLLIKSQLLYQLS